MLEAATSVQQVGYMIQS